MMVVITQTVSRRPELVVNYERTIYRTLQEVSDAFAGHRRWRVA
jgi:hypothetical protein